MYNNPSITYSSNPEPELFGAMLIIAIAVVIGLLVGAAISAVLYYFISSWLKEVPEEDRAMTPGKVWLLLIPLFNFYWMFRVYMLDIPKSFKNYFDRQGDQLVGDCDKKHGPLAVHMHLGWLYSAPRQPCEYSRARTLRSLVGQDPPT